jgi:Zn-dependent peptidase ImmA (M78 family)
VINPLPLPAGDDIEKIARNILVSSKAWGRFPTPIEDIVTFTNLQLSKGIDLSKVEPDFFTSSFATLKRALSKVVGMVDLRQKIIYLDQSQNRNRKNFVTLHEVGHEALSWQSEMKEFLDDDESLDPETEEVFEREASFFASASLFQLEIFEDEAAKLPLSIKSPQVLGKKFGGSVHASIRRYVERCPKRCAVLVLHKPVTNGSFVVPIRDCFQSKAFTNEFGEIVWGDSQLDMGWSFVKDIRFNRRMHEDGQTVVALSSGEKLTFSYHFFNSGHNTFVLLFPLGEIIKSRTIILPKP